MKSKIIVLISLFSLFFSGCGAGASSNAVRDYRLSVGTATMDDFTNLSSRILNRNRFVVDRVENRVTGAFIDTKF